MNTTATRWRFFRSGGFDQPSIDSGDQLLAIGQLDQKLWVALACPTKGLHFDAKTLKLIDSDGDGRIRAPELIAAVKWTGERIKNADELLHDPAALPLASIDDSKPEGARLLESAKRILANLGKGDANAIAPADSSDSAKIFGKTAFNGDGVITTCSTDSEALQAAITEIVACCGSTDDRSGLQGVDQPRIDAFFSALAAREEWRAKSKADPTLLPLGEKTAAAAAAIEAVRSKVEDFFARARVAAYDPRSVAALNRGESEFVAVAAQDLKIAAPEMAHLPLAHIEASAPLPLDKGINPAWQSAIDTLKTSAVAPLLGDKSTLDESDWKKLNALIQPYEKWMKDAAGSSVASLSEDRIKVLLQSDTKQQLSDLVVSDLAEAANANAIDDVDKLARYYCYLYALTRNFVNFRDFYDRSRWANFVAGTLYLDQRSCALCLPVQDAAKHATMAGLAGTYLAYLDCSRKGGSEKMQIVAAFTNGDSDNLMVGRNGIFYDRLGQDWDATITKIIDNPISIRQAFWSPYKKLVRLIDEQIAKRAAAADAAADAKLQSTAAATAGVDPSKPPAPPKKLDIGSVAAIGIAFGAIGTFLATLAAYAVGVFNLGPLAILGALVGVMLLISGPSMLIAFLKLRKRNLGPILDANGWAVNARAKITVPFGAALTKVATLPPGSERQLRDPYAEKRSPWPKLIILAVILWIVYAQLDQRGYIHNWTDGRIGNPPPPPTYVAPEPAPAPTDPSATP